MGVTTGSTGRTPLVLVTTAVTGLPTLARMVLPVVARGAIVRRPRVVALLAAPDLPVLRATLLESLRHGWALAGSAVDATQPMPGTLDPSALRFTPRPA